MNLPKHFQQILFITTRDSDLRSEAIAWDIEHGNCDADKVKSKPDIKVGSLQSAPIGQYLPPTVAHALRVGWRLLSIKDSELSCLWVMTRMVDIYGNFAY